jgi:hypothetical protein
VIGWGGEGVDDVVRGGWPNGWMDGRDCEEAERLTLDHHQLQVCSS